VDTWGEGKKKKEGAKEREKESVTIEGVTSTFIPHPPPVGEGGKEENLKRRGR